MTAAQLLACAVPHPKPARFGWAVSNAIHSDRRTTTRDTRLILGTARRRSARSYSRRPPGDREALSRPVRRLAGGRPGARSRPRGGHGRVRPALPSVSRANRQAGASCAQACTCMQLLIVLTIGTGWSLEFQRGIVQRRDRWRYSYCCAVRAGACPLPARVVAGLHSDFVGTPRPLRFACPRLGGWARQRVPTVSRAW